MLRLPLQLACASLLGLGFLSAGDLWAGALYKCDTGDGSIAYTSSKQGYTNCKLISVFADAPKPPPANPPPQPAAARTEPVKRGWVYEEGAGGPARADFSAVTAAVATAPATIVRADFSGVSGGVLEGAPDVERRDFSRVMADVTSDALMIGVPLFIAAPYRSPPRSRQMPRDTPSPRLASIATAATPKTRTLRGAVYKVERKDGITEYTNVKPRGASFAVLFTYIATCVACDIHSKIDFARTALNLDAYKDEIAAAAADYGVESSLLRAVIHAESAFNPLALSNKGAQGLMQLMPATARRFGVGNAFDASQNIQGGVQYLAWLLKRFNGDLTLAAAGYNAGEGAVDKYKGVPPYSETRRYVERVGVLADRYRGNLASK